MLSRKSNFNLKLALSLISLFLLALACSVLPVRAASTPPSPGKTTPLFDGATLAGWEGT